MTYIRQVLEVDAELLLLGLDMLRHFKCVVDLERDVLVFGGAGGVEVPFLPPERGRQWSEYARGQAGNGGCPTM